MSDLLEAAKKELPGVKWQDMGNDGIEVLYGECDAGKFNVYDYMDINEIRADLVRQRDALDAALGCGWVPASERLPEPESGDYDNYSPRVLVFNSHGEYDAAAYDHRFKEWSNGEEPTHWRPIPAAPEVK